MRPNRLGGLFALIAGLLVAVGISLGVASHLRFAEAEVAWEHHVARATEIGDALAELDRQIGYGGFIHNFKNLVLRRDLQRYTGKIETNVASTRKTLDRLDKVLLKPEDKVAVAEVRRTFEEYFVKFSAIAAMVAAGASSEAIDAVVKVDDGPALTALAHLNGRAQERANDARQAAQEAYADAVRFAWIGRGLLILTILAAAALLYRVLRRLTATGEAALKAQQRLDILLDTAPDAMLSVNSDGRIVRANRMAVQLFGYTADELIGMEIERLIPERYRQAHQGHRQSFRADPRNRAMGAGFSLVALTRDGREPNVDISLSYSGEGDDWLATITIRDTTERERAKQELEAARDEAERASRAKSEFLSSMSHELRTPMNAVLGFAQLMELDENLPEEHKEGVREILKGGYHLLDLINDVLELNKIESGHIDLMLEPVELPSLVGECLNLAGAIARKRNVSISHEGLEGMAVRADRIRLKQALLGLLSNAIKYNREGGQVKVAVDAGKTDMLRIRVSDNGPGIQATRMKELFQPFNRLGREASAIEGTGIGLTIVRQLVELMGGTVDVESEAGMGSTFSIELPRECVADANADVETASGVSEEHSDGAGGMPEHGAEPGQYTVVYIEDNSSSLRLVAQALGQHKHIRLLTARTPSHGIDQARMHRPDLILLDINMPDMDGYQVLSVLKADPALRAVPVVAVTANAMPKDIERGRAAGFDDYLVKPLDIVRFNEVIFRLLRDGSMRKTDAF